MSASQPYKNTIAMLTVKSRCPCSLFCSDFVIDSRAFKKKNITVILKTRLLFFAYKYPKVQKLPYSTT